MSFGTKGCLYNCGDKCTGECLSDFKSNEFNFLETGPNIKYRPIQETLSLFKNGEERYMIDPVFTRTIDYLCLGGAPEKIIDQLIGVINFQQEEIKKLSKQ